MRAIEATPSSQASDPAPVPPVPPKQRPPPPLPRIQEVYEGLSLPPNSGVRERNWLVPLFEDARARLV